MGITKVPLVGGLLLWFTTAQIDGRNLNQNMPQNIVNDWMNNAVLYLKSN